MKKTELRQKIDRLWKLSKKDLEKILKDSSVLFKRGESYLKEVSKKGEKNLEVMLLSLQKERLCYELGKCLVGLSKNKWESSKKIINFLNKIKDINRKIKKLKTQT
ncbi:MAG: hypothetical protein PVI33_00285 [Candidatus Omnitrophota bacterium]|jgi:hypothetical protein